MLFLFWILQPPKPIFIKPSYVAHGENGTRLTFLPNPKGNGSSARAHSRLAWKPPAKSKPQPAPEVEIAKEEEEAAASAESSHASLAGSPYGSVFSGPLSGEEVRPALRIAGSEPVVPASELAGLEGNVIVEITIDERGNIVAKALVQSLAPHIDNKVLAALEDWRFLPATRDGVAIPSKEDVYYHFPVRR